MSRPVGLRGVGLGNVFANLNIMDGAFLSPFRVFWVDPANGSDNNDGISVDKALATIGEAHNRMTAGLNDICALVSDGSTTGSARIVAATTWSKNACHLIGIGAPSMNPRARIASLTGTTAFANFITVTASGCMFKNFSIFNDYAIAAQKTWRDQGGRNYYEGILFGGMGDGTSGHSTTSRVLELGGASASGENIFRRCNFGLDTTLTPGRDVANATIEFVGNSKRNIFDDCRFTVSAKATTVIHILSSGTNPLETFQEFNNCIFRNTYPDSSGSLMAAVATLAAAGNGNLRMNNCTRYGITDWGTNATSLAQIQVGGPAEGATDDVGRGSVAIAS